MTPKKLNILFTFFAYAGNSTGTSEVSDIREWFCRLLLKIKQDPSYTSRIGDVHMETIADTPITMNRNWAVQRAKQIGADILVMVDSDMRPDVHLSDDPSARPFFDVAFDAIYDHYEKGPLVIAAPYGGSPPHENMFVFQWRSMGNLGEESRIELSQYTREEAAQMTGLQEAAALPTGLIAYDIRAFDLIEHPYFHYEWTDETQSKKASTEDVTNTRDIALSGIKHLGYNPVLCAWDSWAGHLKTWCVKKPWKYTTDNVSENLAKALSRGPSNEKEIDLAFQNKDLLERLGGREKTKTNGEPNGKPCIIQPSTNLPKPEKVNDRWVCGHKTPQRHLTYLANLVKTRSLAIKEKVKVIEIGSWLGDSAIAMAETECCEVLCIDTWEGSETDWTRDLAQAGDYDIEAMFFHNVSDLHNISGWAMDSLTAAEKIDSYVGWRDFTPADIIFIDADHSYEATKADILAWLPHVADNGVMVGHDFLANAFPGVTKAVREIFGQSALMQVWSQEHAGMWYVDMKDIDREEILKKHAGILED